MLRVEFVSTKKGTTLSAEPNPETPRPQPSTIDPASVRSEARPVQAAAPAPDASPYTPPASSPMSMAYVPSPGHPRWWLVILGLILGAGGAWFAFGSSVTITGDPTKYSFLDILNSYYCKSGFGAYDSTCQAARSWLLVSVGVAVFGLVLLVIGLRSKIGAGKPVLVATSPVALLPFTDTVASNPAAGPGREVRAEATPLPPSPSSVYAAADATRSAATQQPSVSSSANQAAASASAQIADLFVRPATQSGWMIGIGSVVGSLSMFLPWTDLSSSSYGYSIPLSSQWGLTHPINVLLLVALVGVAATEFMAHRIPKFASRQTAVFAVILVGLGVGLGELNLGGSGGVSLGIGAVAFVLGMLAAGAGAAQLALAVSGARAGNQTTTPRLRL